MAAPHSFTAAGNINLVTHGDHQFAVWYTLDLELHIGRIERGVQTWGVDHDEYEFAGAPRTALALPPPNDEHNFPAVAVDGLGRIHVWANMHNNTLRYVRTVDPHTTDGWLATAGWVADTLPGVGVSNTYPTPVVRPDGSLWLYFRTGVPGNFSGKGNSWYWTRAADATTWTAGTMIAQGLEVPDAGGPGIPGGDANSSTTDETNWSFYPTIPYVESPRDPHPGRMHMTWVWRVTLDGRDNILPSYAYSDDGGVTWAAIDGTALTVPITPLNSHAARMPGSALVTAIQRSGGLVFAALDTPDHGIIGGDSITVDVQDAGYAGTFTVVFVDQQLIAWVQAGADDPAGGVGSVTRHEYVNGGGVAIDELGLPHILLSVVPTRYFRRNAGNTAWLESSLDDVVGGVTHIDSHQALWLRGHLWMLTSGLPSGFRRVYLVDVTGTGHPAIVLSGNVGDGGWEPSVDPEAWRRFGTIEILAPDGDLPRVYTWGNHARLGAAA